MTRAGAEMGAHWVRCACGYSLKKMVPGACRMSIKSIGKASGIETKMQPHR